MWHSSQTKYPVPSLNTKRYAKTRLNINWITRVETGKGKSNLAAAILVSDPTAPQRKKTSYRACRKWKSGTLHKSKYSSSSVICSTRVRVVWITRESVPTRRKGHAEATHKNCPSYSKYRPVSQYILCHTTRDCVTSLLRVRWTMTGCLLALRPCHPVVLTIVATEQRTVLRNWLDLTGIRTIDYCKTARQTGYKTRPGVVR